MENPATNRHPIHDFMRRRWSPRAFSPRPVPLDSLRSLLEAASWAASAYNTQPWRFLLATQDDAAAFARMVECLRPGNQDWARQAPVLILSFAQGEFDKGGANRHAWHDVGQAVATLTLQAITLDLFVHQMAGIEPEKIRAAYAVPEGFEPVSGLAVGYLGDPDTLPDDLKQKEQRERERRPLEEFVFADAWGKSAPL